MIKLNKKIILLGIVTVLLAFITIASIWIYNPGESDISLLAYWKLDGNANDETGVNNGTVNGATITNKGRFGQTYEFDGVNDYINVSNGNSLSISGNISIFTWIYPLASPDETRGVVTKSDYDYVLAIRTNKVRVILRGTTCSWQNSVSTFNLNEWSSIGFTYNGTHLTHYINGVGDTPIACTGNINTQSKDLDIGRYALGSTYFNGTIDEIRIYNRSLSASEVLELYNESLKSDKFVIRGTGEQGLTNETGLVSHWKFQSNANDEMDLNNGTVGGAVITNKGIFGKAYSFNGSSYINLGTNINLSGNQTFTLSAWVKPISSKETAVIISKFNAGSNGEWNFYLYNRAVAVHMECGTYTHFSSATLSLNKWAQVVFVYDGEVKKIYINGAFDSEESGSCSLPSTTEKVVIGAGDNAAFGFENFFNGTIDEIRIYNRSLSASEVLELYNESLKSDKFVIRGTGEQGLTNETDLLAYWKLDGNILDTIDKNNGSFNVVASLTNKGRFGQAYEWDASSNQYIDISPSASIDTPYDVTISFWYHRRGTTGSYGRFFSREGSQFELAETSGNFYYYFKNSSNSAFGWRNTGISVPNDWTHVVVVSNASFWEIYLDGVSKYTNTENAVDFLTGGDFRIGGGGGAASINGTIDEFRIYNRSLSASEVLELYNESLKSDKFILRGSGNAN